MDFTVIHVGLADVAPGDLAWHVDGLDPRPVVSISEDRSTISIDVHELVVPGLPSANYTFTRPAEA